MSAGDDPAAVRRVWVNTDAFRRGDLLTRFTKQLTVPAATAFVRTLRTTVAQLPANASRSIGVVTHAPLAEKLFAIENGDGAGDDEGAQVLAKELRALKASGHIDDLRVLYYGGQRGSNLLENCGAVLVLGDPWPNLGAAEEDARTLGFDDAEPHTNNLLRDEVVQAIGRARTVRRTPADPVLLVYAGTVWPGRGFEYSPLSLGGPVPSIERLVAEAVGHDLLEGVGAICPALVRLAASDPRVYRLLRDQWGSTSIKENSSNRSCPPLPPHRDFVTAAGLPGTGLRDALRAVVDTSAEPAIEASTFDPTRAGGNWRWRETRPGAAQQLAEVIRDLGVAEVRNPKKENT